MANHSTSDKLWIYVGDETNNNGLSRLRLTEHDLTRLQIYQTHRGHVRLYSNSCSTIDPTKIKINNKSTGSSLNKHEHVYRKENVSVNRPTRDLMMEQSMLVYTQKMQELTSRKNLTLSPQEKEQGIGLVNNSSSVATSRRWATLQKLRKQAADLRSISDSHWNYSNNERQRNKVNSKHLERPKSDLHFMVRNNELQHQEGQVFYRPRSESDGLMFNNSRSFNSKSNKGYYSNGDSTSVDSKHKNDPNILTFPDVTGSMDNFNMDTSSSIQIVPFPGIEVQAVPAVLHNNGLTFGRNNLSKQSKSNKLTKDITNKSKHVPCRYVREKGKLMYNGGLKTSANTNGKASCSVAASKDSKHLKHDANASTDCKGKHSKVKLKPLDGSVSKRPAAASLNNSRIKASQKPKEVDILEEENEVTNYNMEAPIIFESNDDDLSQEIKSVLKKKSKTDTKNKRKKSVQFGERMVREVTKIVYPWNRDSFSDDDDIVKDDIDVYIMEDDDDDSTEESDINSIDSEDETIDTNSTELT